MSPQQKGIPRIHVYFFAMAIYGTNYVGSKAEETNDIIKLLEENIDEINKVRIRHKTTKPKDIQKIIIPKDKKNILYRNI